MQPVKPTVSTGLMARFRSVEDALNEPENEPIQNGVNLIMDVYKNGNSKKKSRDGSKSLDSIIESQAENAQKVNNLILSIRKYISKSSMNEASKEGFFLDVNFYVFQKLWPMIEKEYEDILVMDKKFADHLADLKVFITTKFLGFPDTITNETFTTHSLFPATIKALKFLEFPNSPCDKLQIIYGIYKNCNQILSEYGLVSSADALVNIFIFMIVQAEVKNIVSNIIFLNLFVLPEDRNGEMFCYFVSFNLAYEYLEKIEPGTILIKTPLDTKKEPKILRDRIPKSDYREIISAISRFTKKTKFSSMRAKSVKKGLSIGLALSIPIAAVVGMASLGLGTPLSVLIVSAGAGIGSACGAVNPKDLKKSFGDFNSYIENLNDTVLKEKGVFLVSPLVTNSFSNLFGISQSSARKISHVQWIVKTSPSDVGDPAVGCSHDGKDEEYDDDDDDDADNGLYGTSSDDDSSDDDDDEYCSYYSDDDNGHHHYLFGRSKKRAVNCSLDDLKSPESGSSTSSEDDEIIQGVEDMEETLFSFMNFDFIRDDDRKVMRLQRSKSSISIRGDDKKSSKKKMERGKKKKKSKDDRHSYPGIIVVTPNPYKNEGDDDVAYDSDGGYGSVSRKCLETLEVEDISSGNSSDDDDVGYDDTKSFSGDYKLRVIRKWD